MEEKYVPSEELMKLAVSQFRRGIVIPLLRDMVMPWTWVLPGDRDEFLYNLSLVGKNARKNMGLDFEEVFYGTIESISFRNVSLGKDTTLLAKVDEQNFEPQILGELGCGLMVASDRVMGRLKEEFTSYVIDNDGFSLNYGRFFESDRGIYFKDDRELPKMSGMSGRTKVVGGLDI